MQKLAARPYARLILFLLLSYLGTALLSRFVIPHFIAYRPTGPANPINLLLWLIHPRENDDSWSYMALALNVLHGPDHAHLYETLFFDLKTKFIYPLSSLLPLELLGQFFTLSARRLNAVNSVVYCLTLAGMLVLARTISARASRLALIVPTLLACWLFYPLLRAVGLGQIQLWIDALFIWSCAGYAAGHRLTSGLLLGLACTLKPQLSMFLVWALVWREYRFGAGFLVGYVPLALLSVLRYGLHNFIAYLNVLSYISRHGEAEADNQSLNGLINHLIWGNQFQVWDVHNYAPYNSTVYAVTMAGGIVFTLIPLLSGLLLRRRRPATTLDLALTSLSFTLASPIVWEHRYGVALPAYLLALHTAWDQKRSPALLITLGISWTLLANYMPWLNSAAGTRAGVAQSYMLIGALLLLAVTWHQTIALARSITYKARLEQAAAE
jgi:hypothetical protein